MVSVRHSFLIALSLFTSATALADKPDLTGLWTNASLTNLERPASVTKLVLSEAEAVKLIGSTSVAGIDPDELSSDDYTDPNQGAPEKGGADFGLRGYNAFWTDPGSSLARVKGELRSSLIVDPATGKVPWKAGAQRNSREFAVRYFTGVGRNANPEELPLAERCLIGFGNTGGPGMMGTLYNSNYQFVQTESHLMILVEMNHDARIIPLFDSAKEARANHKTDIIKPWLGDSVGWFEGSELVVETVNVKPLQLQQSNVRITENGRVIERFRRHTDGEIVYRFTVEDDSLYSQAWTAELSFYQTEGPIFEYACHEGNYAMAGILGGARLKEKQAAGE